MHRMPHGLRLTPENIIEAVSENETAFFIDILGSLGINHKPPFVPPERGKIPAHKCNPTKQNKIFSPPRRAERKEKARRAFLAKEPDCREGNAQRQRGSDL